MTARSWEDMRAQIAAQLLRQTGHDVGWWNAAVVGQAGLGDEAALRAWLTGQGVTGYPQGMEDGCSMAAKPQAAASI